jgi:hypothetical protein
MPGTLHITSGDSSGDSLIQSGVPGDVLVWRDILYDGPRRPGWPGNDTLEARARFLEDATAGGLARQQILVSLNNQYKKLAASKKYTRIVLCFDACLFDQSMLTHILTCLHYQGIRNVELLCVDAFPGIEPFNGLGQLEPSQLASLYDRRLPVTETQFEFAGIVDNAFANQDPGLLSELSRMTDPPIPWIPSAVARWLMELPDPVTGLGRLESLALEAIRGGCDTPVEIFSTVAVADTPPQYWGDITLWAKINGLADRDPPLVKISGPAPRLPQWEGVADLKHFRITGLSVKE